MHVYLQAQVACQIQATTLAESEAASLREKIARMELQETQQRLAAGYARETQQQGHGQQVIVLQAQHDALKQTAEQLTARLCQMEAQAAIDAGVRTVTI